MRKVLSVILSIVTIVTVFSAFNFNVYADECENGEHFFYSYDSNNDKTHEVYCLYCDYHYTENCDLKYEAYEGTHSLYCEKCDYFVIQDCSYDKTVEKATTSKNGSITYVCKKCKYKKVSKIAYPKTITLSTTKYTYNGETKKPGVTVKDSNGKKISSDNYSLTYSKGRKSVGKYTVKISFKGNNYSGSVTKSFTIVPKGTTISSATAKNTSISVKWKKQATQTTGYQIRYSLNSDMSSSKTVTVSKNSTTSKTISSLKSGKKYYVQVRTYKKIDDKKYYSSWSSKVSAKTTAKSSKKSTNKSSKSTSSKNVYITKTGKRYHYDSNCGNGTYYKTTLSDAKKRNLTPCQKCCK